jgi:hypothetical protein
MKMNSGDAAISRRASASWTRLFPRDTNQTIPMSAELARCKVIVSEKSFRSPEGSEIIYSNVWFVNALKERLLTEAEIPVHALRSYYVDYYYAQRLNGGFSQFIYNSKGDPSLMRHVHEGLSAMGAQRHLAHLRGAEILVERLGQPGLKRFFASLYFGRNRDRDELNAADDEFESLQRDQDLGDLNAKWLRQLPDLQVMPDAEMEAEIERRVAFLRDLPERQAAALAAEPDFKKSIRALCAAAGHKFERVTAGTQIEFRGEKPLAWHFRTDQGVFAFVELKKKKFMLRHRDYAVVLECDAE